MFHLWRADVLFIVCEIMLLSVNHEQLLMQISRSRKRNNGGTLKEFGPVFFLKKERKSRYKSNFQYVSLCRQVYLWICRAMFLQRAFQFGFLNPVETLSFFSLKSSFEFVLHCENFISLLASPPKYRSTFQLCTIGGFHAISGDTNNNGEMNNCWWTNKAS